MFSVLLVAAGFGVGLPTRDQRIELPAAPAPCMSASEDCGVRGWNDLHQDREPPRECPKGTSPATVRQGVWYCMPDRAIGQ